MGLTMEAYEDHLKRTTNMHSHEIRVKTPLYVRRLLLAVLPTVLKLDLPQFKALVRRHFHQQYGTFLGKDALAFNSKVTSTNMVIQKGWDVGDIGGGDTCVRVSAHTHV